MYGLKSKEMKKAINKGFPGIGKTFIFYRLRQYIDCSESDRVELTE
jgi:hypothetical protein